MRLAPFIDGRGDVDELFNRFLEGMPTTPSTRTAGDVPMDVFHTEDRLVIRLDLPGVDPSKVDVTVQENVLLINGSRPFPFEPDQVRFVRRGAFYGDFTQRVALGKGLDLERIQARYDSGVLELTIPYAPEVQPRKIEVAVEGQDALGK